MDDHINCGLGHAAAPPPSVLWNVVQNVNLCVGHRIICVLALPRPVSVTVRVSMGLVLLMGGAEFRFMDRRGDRARERDTAIQLCPWGGTSESVLLPSDD